MQIGHFLYTYILSAAHACSITHARNESHIAILEAYNYAGAVNTLPLVLVLVEQSKPCNFSNHLVAQTVYFWVARLDNIKVK